MAQNANSRQSRYRGRRRGNNKPKTTNNSASSNTTVRKDKECKFYLHNSNERCSAESFNKIKDAIIVKIQKTFDSPRETIKILRDKAKQTFVEPQVAQPTGNSQQEIDRDYQHMTRKWKEDYRWYQSKLDQYEDNFFKAFTLI